MIPYKSVSVWLSIRLGVAILGSGACLAAFASTPSEIGCGSYRVKGELVRNSSADFVVRLAAAGAGISEVILLGGDTLSKLENLGTPVAAEIYVPQNIRTDNAPFAYLQRWLPYESKGEAVVKIGPAACGERARFQTK